MLLGTTEICVGRLRADQRGKLALGVKLGDLVASAHMLLVYTQICQSALFYM